MTDDADLLRRFAEAGDQRAFAEWVERRIGVVYAVARRKLGGDAHLAEDVTQRVFADAARSAGRLCRHPAPCGWLFASTHFAATQVVRAEQRRRKRETEAQAMHEQNQDPAVVEWEKLRPVLDDLIAQLGEREREGVLLRFYEGRSWAEVGARLHLTEAAARSRVERALERLRGALGRHGDTASTAALGLVLAGQAGAAPLGLAAKVAAGAMVGGSAAAVGGWTFMGITKLQVSLLAGAAATGAVVVGGQVQTAAELRREIAAVRPAAGAMADLRAENRRLAEVRAEAESLRRDDAELKRLETVTAELRRGLEQRARDRAAAQRAEAAARHAELAAEIRAKDRRVQEEMERMNREGNVLVVAYKALAAQAQVAGATADERAAAEAAANAKLEEVKTKQREIKEFVANAQAALGPLVAELRRLSAGLGVAPSVGTDGATPAAAGPGPSGGRLELRPAPAAPSGSRASDVPAFEFKVGGKP